MQIEAYCSRTGVCRESLQEWLKRGVNFCDIERFNLGVSKTEFDLEQKELLKTPEERQKEQINKKEKQDAEEKIWWKNYWKKQEEVNTSTTMWLKRKGEAVYITSCQGGCNVQFFLDYGKPKTNPFFVPHLVSDLGHIYKINGWEETVSPFNANGK